MFTPQTDWFTHHIRAQINQPTHIYWYLLMLGKMITATTESAGMVGVAVGVSVGAELGAKVGANVGAGLGAEVGESVGLIVSHNSPESQRPYQRTTDKIQQLEI